MRSACVWIFPILVDAILLLGLSSLVALNNCVRLQTGAHCVLLIRSPLGDLVSDAKVSQALWDDLGCYIFQNDGLLQSRATSERERELRPWQEEFSQMFRRKGWRSQRSGEQFGHF